MIIYKILNLAWILLQICQNMSNNGTQNLLSICCQFIIRHHYAKLAVNLVPICLQSVIHKACCQFGANLYKYNCSYFVVNWLPNCYIKFVTYLLANCRYCLICQTLLSICILFAKFLLTRFYKIRFR